MAPCGNSNDQCHCHAAGQHSRAVIPSWDNSSSRELVGTPGSFCMFNSGCTVERCHASLLETTALFAAGNEIKWQRWQAPIQKAHCSSLGLAVLTEAWHHRMEKGQSRHCLSLDHFPRRLMTYLIIHEHGSGVQRRDPVFENRLCSWCTGFGFPG